MKRIETNIEGACLIEPRVFHDDRGFFLESYSRQKFAQIGIACPFVQDNHSRSLRKGVLRGLHFQHPPAAQAKLVRVSAGAVYDVIVDLRTSSPTYGKWQGFELSAKNFLMLFVPPGCAHGFCAIEPNTDVMYKVDTPYSPEHDSGIIWNDPTLAVQWPVDAPLLSTKDAQLERFGDLDSPF